MSRLQNYKNSTDANVAMMFAVTAVMILTAIGAAVDYTNMTRAQIALQAQVDAGVLAAATAEIERLPNGDLKQEKKTREKVAFDVAEANGFDLNGEKPILEISDDSVILTAGTVYRPAFGGVLGINEIAISAVAEAGLPTHKGVEIVLVLDNTASMQVNGKLDALKSGASKLIDAIEASNPETKIGIVPFARYVRLDDDARLQSWFEMPMESIIDRTFTTNIVDNPGTCITETMTRLVDGVEQEYDSLSCEGRTYRQEEVTTTIESRWEGCVGTRIPPFSERDSEYTHKIPGLLNYKLRENTGLSYDVGSSCPTAITPMTNDYVGLRDAINEMSTIDSTYLPIGIAWGQRVISPGEPFDNSSNTDGIEKTKVMIVMTDGHNTTQIEQDSLAESEFRSPPYISNIAVDAVATEANMATLRMCNNAKAADIEIYTIAFQVDDASTIELLRKCASSNNKAFTATSNSALVEKFANLASQLDAEIRLIR